MEKETQNQKARPKHQLWDCESTLYDSFERKSFERQLESAITTRTMSMPRLSSSSSLRQQPQHSKKHSRLTRSFNKLLRSVFGSRLNNNTLTKDEAFYLYDTSGPLSTIPEVPDFDMLSPTTSLVRRTRSDRFMPTSLGISCA